LEVVLQGHIAAAESSFAATSTKFSLDKMVRDCSGLLFHHHRMLRLFELLCHHIECKAVVEKFVQITLPSPSNPKIEFLCMPQKF